MKLSPKTVCCFIALPFLITVLNLNNAWAEGITVGVVLPMSGTHAAYGHMQKNSMLMAVEEINSRGGISGEPLGLDIRDSGGQSRNVRAIIDHFVKDRQYSVVLGGFTSSVSTALAEKCEQRRIPVLIVTGSEDAITLQGHQYVFRVAPPRSRYPAAALGFARASFNRATIALITERSSYGDSMARNVMQAAREARWDVAGEWKFDMGSRNLEPLLKEVTQADPDVIFLTAFPPDGSRIIIELRGRDSKSAIFNLTPASTAAGSYARCGDACMGVMNPSLWLPGQIKEGERYKEKYLARFNTEPDYHGAQAYAAVIAAALAIRKAGVAEPEPVRDALEGILANTPYGRVSFKQWGGFANQNDPANYLFQWSGRGFEVVWPERYRTANPVLPNRDSRPSE